jgi:hypothetical protein
MTGRRDRHGRGLRGPLAPASSPASVTRMERFGDLVGAAVDRLEPRWRAHVSAVDVEIQDAPPVADAAGSDDPVDVPLAGYRLGRGPSEAPVTVVVFRRPVELRAPDRPARVDLLRDLVAEQLADALGVAPGDLDPSYDDGTD